MGEVCDSRSRHVLQPGQRGVQRQNKDMALQLAPEEPEAGPWCAELMSTVVEMMTRREPGNATPSRPVVLAVDGRSNAGKTTLAARICQAVPGSAPAWCAW